MRGLKYNIAMMNTPPSAGGRKFWTQREIRWIVNHRNEFSASQIAERLGRSLASVYCALSRRGIPKQHKHVHPHPNKVKLDEIEQIVRLFGTHSNRAIASALGRDVNTI